MIYADILLHKATLLYRQDRLHAALHHYKKGIAVHKRLQSGFLKPSKYLTNTVYQRLYCAAIEIAAKLNLPEEAFTLSEANKSPVLCETVARKTLPVDTLLACIPDNAVSISYSYSDSLLVTIIAGRAGVKTTLTPVTESFTAAIDTFVSHTLNISASNEGYRAYVRASNTLFRLLIPELSANVTRLLISPYGKLHQLSFDALTPSEAQDNFHYPGFNFLLHNFAVTYVPSLTIYATLKGSGVIEKMALFAPGHADIPDKLVEKMKQTMQHYAPFEYLPGTLANEEALFNTKSGIVNILTHGKDNLLILNNDTVFDHEIATQALNHNLAILTACYSGSGKNISNEGMLSAGYAFLEAGSRSVLQSISTADGRIAQIILDDFFNYLNEGDTKDVALQKAKLNYLNSESGFFASPVFWANYHLTGDNSSVVFRKRDSYTGYWIIAGVILLILSGVIIVRKKH